MKDYVLGLDIGPNSIGWAVVGADFSAGEPVETGFLDTSAAGHPPLGVRVFEEGLAAFDTRKERSLAQERRTKRSLRRVLARRRERSALVLRILREAGLLPGSDSELAKVLALDPYRLRKDALDRPLDSHELGRAIFHLARRRGFKSNRKGGKGERPSERRAMLTEMRELRNAIGASGARTLGEYLHSMHKEGQSRGDGGQLPAYMSGDVRIRARLARMDLFNKRPLRASRDLVQKEFEAILQEQSRLRGREVLSDADAELLRHAIFDQRDFAVSDERRSKAPPRANLHRSPHLKRCPLEPSEPRCSRSEWIAQRFRILKEVANLRVWEPGRRERRLGSVERDQLVKLLSEQKEVKFAKITKDLGLADRCRFNLERGNRDGLDGNGLDALLASALGKRTWRELPEGERQELRGLVQEVEEEPELREKLARWIIKPDYLDKLLSWEPDDRYIAFSRKALESLVPLMEGGLDEYEAISKAYPQSGEAKVWVQLPSLVTPGVPAELAGVSNQIVRRSLVEVRKVVNALLREHGKPRRVVIELAREMRMGPKERQRLSHKISERRDTRREAQSEVEGILGGRPTRDQIDTYLLWKEQGGHCIYSGRMIGQTQLYSADVEVDHVIPRSISLDDSRANRVLCFADKNREKGQRTPLQWLGFSSDAFCQVLDRAEEMHRMNGLPGGTLARLATEVFDPGDFVDRQLNDTRFIGRLVARYLELLYPPDLRVGQKAVLTSRGGLTAELRRRWGLGGVLDPLLDGEGRPVPEFEEIDGHTVKRRIDHRHHAVDAVVIALSSRSRLKRYQDFWAASTWEHRVPGHAGIQFGDPWEGFRDDVERNARRIQVSHRPMRKISGAFHDDTYYGPARDRAGNAIPGKFVTRKRLEDLTWSMVGDIVDRRVRGLIEERLKQAGWNGVDKKLPKDWWREELRFPNGMPVRRVRIRVTIEDPLDFGHRYAISSNNHHLEFAPFTTGSKLEARVMRTVDVAREVRQNGGRLTMLRGDEQQFPIGRTLARKESVLVRPPEGGQETLCVVQVLSGSRTTSTTLDLYVRDARDSRPATTGNRSPFKRFKSTGALVDWRVRKVQVDPLGRVLSSGD